MPDIQSTTPPQNDVQNDVAVEPKDSDPLSATKDEDGHPAGSTNTALMVIDQPDDDANASIWERFLNIFRSKPESIRHEITEALSSTKGDFSGFSADERAMLHNILRLNEVRVSDVMIPRGEIEAVELGTTLADLLTHFERSGHSRMPVYSDTLDDPRGMVHIRDIMGYLTRASLPKSRGRKPKMPSDGRPAYDLGRINLDATIATLKLWRPVLFVPPSMPAAELMKQMQARRIQMALVIDEYGGTDGLASLEDIVEMVVGDIEDEHDDEYEAMITASADGSFLVDARAEIEEVEKMIGSDFKVGDAGEEVDTIGGLVVGALGHLPVRGEIARFMDGFEFEIVEADARRVRRIRIRPVRQAEPRRQKKVTEKG